MKRALVVVLVLLSTLSVDAQRRRSSGSPGLPPPPPPPNVTLGSALPGLDAEHIKLFQDGRIDFVELRAAADGLGPVFNAESCARCHAAPATGGMGGFSVQRIARVVDGVYDDLTQFGGGLLQSRGIGDAPGTPPHRFLGERIPKEATIPARRRTQTLFGLGLVDATDDSTFIALAAKQAARGDGVVGRVALVQNILNGMKTVGKFGWKAQIATLQEFSADAYLNEIGITNPLFPDELCPSGDCSQLQFNPRPGLNDSGKAVDGAANFMRFLAPPSRGAITPEVTAGEAVFARIGCDTCHTPTLQTGSNPIAALDRVTYHPFSDFLLHDMGSLGDGIVQPPAMGTEFRTQPLWGIRHVTRFLHDGRATELDAAILAHDGQGRGARDRFELLNATEKAQLLAFLRSL